MAKRAVLYEITVGGDGIPKLKQFNQELKNTGAAASTADNKTQNLRKTFAGFGGQAGATGAKVINLAEGLGGLSAGLGTAAIAIGGATLAIGALALGLGLAVKAANSMVTAAAEASKRLKDLGLTTIEQEEAIGRLTEAQKEMRESWDQLKVSFATVLEPILKGLLELWKSITEAIQKAIDKGKEAMGTTEDTGPLPMTDFGRNIGQGNSLDLSGLKGGLTREQFTKFAQSGTAKDTAGKETAKELAPMFREQGVELGAVARSFDDTADAFQVLLDRLEEEQAIRDAEAERKAAHQA